MSKTLTISQIQPQDLPRWREPIKRVYRAAFAAPPYNEGEAETDQAVQTLIQHARREGFRCCLAQDEQGEVVGVAFGYRGQAGQWWHDFVSKLLDAAAREHWLKDCFEFVEIAVAPTAQGHGIGGRLHDALLAGLPYRTAVLTTFAGETRALTLFVRRGWKTLVPDLTLPGSSSPAMLLGLDLVPSKGESV